MPWGHGDAGSNPAFDETAPCFIDTKEGMTMLEFLKKEANKTYTENMAVTHVSTLSDCLDLFATVGALRESSGVGV